MRMIKYIVVHCTATPPDAKIENIENFKNHLAETRAAAADPLYEQWRTMQVHPTPAIKALIPRLEKSGAFTMAQELSDTVGLELWLAVGAVFFGLNHHRIGENAAKHGPVLAIDSVPIARLEALDFFRSQ